MLESASMTVSSTVSSIAGALSGLWASMTATVGVIPAVVLTGAAAVGLYVGVKWLWRKAKTAWNNQGAQVNQTPAPATV